MHVPRKSRKRADQHRVRVLPRSLHNPLHRRNQAWRMYNNGVLSARARYMPLQNRCKVRHRCFLRSCESQILHCKIKKRSYAYVNNKLHSSSRISKLVLSNGSVVSSEPNIACAFRSEFNRIYALASVRDVLPHFPVRCSSSNSDPVFDQRAVFDALRLAGNSAAGPDFLPGIFYRNLASVLARPLSIVFQPVPSLALVPVMKKRIRKNGAIGIKDDEMIKDIKKAVLSKLDSRFPETDVVKLHQLLDPDTKTLDNEGRSNSYFGRSDKSCSVKTANNITR